MESPLDDIAFLALSENRVAILEALSDERPHSRHELMEATGVSRPTLTRILDDLDARTWIRQRGQECRITPLGLWIHEEFAALLETVEAERDLREAVPLLPFDRLPFDVRRLRDADVVHATESDPTAPIRRAAAELRAGERYRIVSHQVAPEFFDAVADGVLDGEKTLVGVTTPGVYETILSDERMARAFRELADSEAATFLVVDDLELVLHLVDERVCLGVTDDRNRPQALVVTHDDAVSAWAEETFEALRRDARPVDPAGFAP